MLLRAKITECMPAYCGCFEVHIGRRGRYGGQQSSANRWLEGFEKACASGDPPPPDWMSSSTFIVRDKH